MRKNPFTMRGVLDRCWLFTYQMPEAAARALLPSKIEPVAHGGCAFWNVVVCRIRAMRPRGLPLCMGLNYWHAAYRMYARAHCNGAWVEGLYFLRSDVDSRTIAMSGNALTDFRFHLARIDVRESGERIEGRIESPDASASFAIDRNTAALLPDGSAFTSLAEAAELLKYKPAGISLDERGRLNIIRINRDEAAWRAKLVHVANAHWSFLREEKIRLEICYEVQPIAYQWNRGELCQPCVSS